MKVLKDIKVEKIEDVQWVVTVPAIWSNTAKNKMREAALRAGLIKRDIFNHLKIIVLNGPKKKKKKTECGSIAARRYCDLKKDDKYILLDLGGGTADIACHCMWDNMRVSQIHAPSGGPWGSTYIDEAFWGILCEMFGREMMEEFKVKCPNSFIRLKEDFRLAKHNYKPTPSEPPIVEISSIIDFMDKRDIDIDTMVKKVKEYKLKDKSGIIELDEDIGSLCIGHEGWIYLMEQVVDPLIKHVHTLLMKRPLQGCQTMLCVGGLSTSHYVIQRLRDEFITKHKMIKTITKPEEPILAVMEGAVRFGMDPSSIVAYVMTYTYGLRCARVWAEYDGEDGKIWSEEDHMYIFEHGFEVFTRKNDKMNVYDPPIVKYFQPLKKGNKEITVEIHRSDDEDPKRCTDATVCARGTFELPGDWWEGTGAEEKEIPIAFFFNRAEIQVKRLFWPPKLFAVIDTPNSNSLTENLPFPKKSKEDNNLDPKKKNNKI
ncbi:hypothetical protein RFI_26357 [Reticulomyxa filosa]|uniref:Uncharacterized protein n=1 Tax=Reticulomyxa filosa TaxID=46433 RepID=X6MDA2_RETFI|nr:hypothetical protein RFI_26357 [Reticulomyxa filosa]|eukprot:ETO11020.1 hypothetical protein RFI_26357 [Reticulomyxa filosa]